MTFPKEMLDLADQRAKERWSLKTILWNLQINANIFGCCYFYVIACILKPIRANLDTRGKVIVSASVSIYKKSSSAIIAYAITDSKGMFAITFPVLILK
jgi:hypothetical protein